MHACRRARLCHARCRRHKMAAHTCPHTLYTFCRRHCKREEEACLVAASCASLTDPLRPPAPALAATHKQPHTRVLFCSPCEKIRSLSGRQQPAVHCTTLQSLPPAWPHTWLRARHAKHQQRKTHHHCVNSISIGPETSTERVAFYRNTSNTVHAHQQPQSCSATTKTHCACAQ